MNPLGSRPADDRPRVVLVTGDPGPQAVAVHRIEHGLYVAVVDTRRPITPAQVADEVDERFGAGGYRYADLTAVLA